MTAALYTWANFHWRFSFQGTQFQRLLLYRPSLRASFCSWSLKPKMTKELWAHCLCTQGCFLPDSWRTEEVFVYSCLSLSPRGAVSALGEVGDLLFSPLWELFFVVVPKVLPEVSISDWCSLGFSQVLCHSLTRMKSSGPSDFPALPKPSLVAMAFDYSRAELDADGWNHLWHVINLFNSLLLSNEIQ